MRMPAAPAIVAVIALIAPAAALAIVPLPPTLVVPAGLNPDNVEIVFEAAPGELNNPKLTSKPWGRGFKCGINCVGFAGPPPLGPGDEVTLSNLRLVGAAGGWKIKITSIFWTCGKDGDGVGIRCPGQPPADIYDNSEDELGDPLPPVKETPSDATPVYANVLAIPEPATWAMMVAGFGLIGGVLRGRPRVVDTIA